MLFDAARDLRDDAGRDVVTPLRTRLDDAANRFPKKCQSPGKLLDILPARNNRERILYETQAPGGGSNRALVGAAAHGAWEVRDGAHATTLPPGPRAL